MPSDCRPAHLSMKRLSCIFARISCSSMMGEAPPQRGEEPARLLLRENAHKRVCLRADENAMRIIKVATDDGNAYYDIVSRLQEDPSPVLSSLSPGEAVDSVQDLVLTSRRGSMASRGMQWRSRTSTKIP